MLQAIIISGLWLFICFMVLKNIFPDNKDYQIILYQSVPIFFGLGIVYYSLSIMFYYLFLSYRDLQEKTRNEAELKALVKETELNLLKSQINPHFLFNSLNSISSLTLSNPGKAQEMIIKLSEFLRHSINKKNDHLVPLKEEITHIQYYLDIEKIRFGDRLHYDFMIVDNCRDHLVPGMLLQPLFENAIKHGVYESTEEVVISFNCTPVNSGLKLTISNNFDPDALPRKGNNMGIKNIVNRLKLLYQSDNLLTITKTEHFFKVEIVIPE
jgi:LytS/YehU family sensor histidine kinase